MQERPEAALAEEKGDARAVAATRQAARDLLDQDQPEAALALLDQALSGLEDQPRQALLLAQDYVDILLRGIDNRTRLPPEAPNPAEAALALVLRHPVLARPHLMWLDHKLRVNRSLAIATRMTLWSMMLDQQPGIPLLLTLLELAANARAFTLYDRAAAQLQQRLAPRLEEGPAEDAPRWCIAGDAHLLRDDWDAAAACYANALRLAPGDARALLGQACLRLDQGDLRAAAALGRQAAQAFAVAGQEEAARTLSILTGFWDAPRRAESFEIVIFCHVTSKLRRNAHMAAPGIALVETAMRSLRQAVGPGPEVPITLYYDHRLTPTNNAFAANLLDFCTAEGLGLAINTDHGLRRQWLQAFERAEADVVMVIEQDHEFLPPCPDLAAAAALFRQRPDLHQLRFNRRHNTRVGFDVMLMQTPRDVESGVSRTGFFSNQPHFLRRDFYEALVKPTIAEAGGYEGRNAGAAGVEENINNLIRRMEPLIGMPALLRVFGLAVWGVPGQRATVTHLGV